MFTCLEKKVFNKAFQFFFFFEIFYKIYFWLKKGKQEGNEKILGFSK